MANLCCLLSPELVWFDGVLTWSQATVTERAHLAVGNVEPSPDPVLVKSTCVKTLVKRTGLPQACHNLAFFELNFKAILGMHKG